jgi:hypothetical protein
MNFNKVNKIIILTIGFILIGQIIALHHNAQHQFLKHDHNGKQCEIYLSFKKDKNIDVIKKIFIEFIAYEYSDYFLNKKTYLNSNFKILRSRSPPLFLS